MPTIVRSEDMGFDPAEVNTGFQQNHGVELTTEGILKSLGEIMARPEIEEMHRLIRESGQYHRGNSAHER